MIPRYTRPELGELWSDRHRYETWLRVELAACEAMEAAGSVPAGTAAAVRAKAAGKLDPPRILEHEERTRHDVIAFLTHVEELAGEPARWLHLGHDLLGRARRVAGAHRCVEAADEILAGVDLLRAACRRRAEEHRATLADRALARHPRRADHRRAGVRGLLRRARPRPVGAVVARGPRSRSARSPARSAPTPTSIPRSKRAALAALGLRRRDRPDPDRRARPPRRVLHGARAARHRGRADRARPSATGSAPRWARRGGLRQGAEGLLGDAAQEEPDPVREPVRAGAPAARLRRRPRSRTSPCGTSATSRTRRSSG